MSDTGRGMETAILPQIFDPYFPTNKKEDGTGLGLAVVHGIVRKLSGMIAVYSEPGTGSTFEIYLPVYTGALEYKTPIANATALTGTESILLTTSSPCFSLQSEC